MSLLDRYREGSEFAEHGEFTLDGSRAKDKMAHFQLTREEDFLLLIVQAMVAASALSLTIQISQSDQTQTIRLVAHKVHLEAQKLHKLDEFLFDEKIGNRPYTLLGIALNSIQLKCQEPPRLAYSAGCLELEFTLTEVLKHLSETVEQRVRYAPCELTLNGKLLKQSAISESWNLRNRDWQWSVLELVRHGVVIESKRVAILPSFSATVSHPDFAVDASFTHVIENEVFESVLLDFEKKLLATVDQAAQNFDDSERRQLLQWVLDLSPSRVTPHLKVAKIYPAADREGSFSLAELEAEFRSKGYLYSSRSRFEIELGEVVLLCLDALMESTLRKSLGQNLEFRSARQLYSDRRTYLENKRRWEESPREFALPPGRYKVQRSLSGKSWQALVGIELSGGLQKNVLHVLYQGKFLFTENLSPYLPPGSVGTVNLEVAELDHLWSKASGPTFLNAVEDIERELRIQFESITRFETEELSWDMREFLLAQLCSPAEVLPKCATATAVFPSADGSRTYSFEELQRRVLIYLGKNFVPQSANFPEGLIPEPLLAYSDSTFKMLKRRLKGKSSVFDFRRSLSRFAELDRQFLDPPGLSLPSQINYLETESFSGPELRAEFGLFPQPTPTWSLAFFRDGICLETREIVLTKVFSARAAVDCSRLVPKSDWSGFKIDDRYKSIRRSVRKKLEQMERGLVHSSKVSLSTKFKLILAYPDLLAELEDTPLFVGTRSAKRYSIAELREDHAEYNCLLMSGAAWTTRWKVRVLKPPSADAKAVLEKVFGPTLKVENAHTVLSLLERKAAFEEAEIHQKIELTGEYRRKVPLQNGEGELGMFCSKSSDAGLLHVFIEGRLVESRRGLLPHFADAAIQHPSLQFSSDMTEISFPPGLVTELLALCQREIFEELDSEDEPTLKALAFDYLKLLIDKGRVPYFFQEYPVLRRMDGPHLSVAEALQFGLSRISYVSPNSSAFKEVELPEGVFLHSEFEIKLICEASGGALKRYDMGQILLKKKRNQEYLDSLVVDLPDGVSFREFRGSLLKAKLRVVPESSLIGFNKDGKVLGYVAWDGLPVSGQVFGLTPSSDTGESPPAAYFEPYTKAQFSNFVSNLYYDWFREQFQETPSWETRAAAFSALCRYSSLIAGHASHPESRLAQLLWDLPLFPLANRTWTSGAALAIRLADSETPIQVTDTARRAPGDALLLQPGSVEKRILTEVLGKDATQWYEAPGLLDAGRIKQSIKNLAGWGLSPLRSLRARFRGAGDSEGADKPDQESLLLCRLHQDLNDLLGSQRVKEADGHFCRTDFGTWILGPPLYCSSSRKHFRFNRLHPSIKWLLNSETETREHRVARMLLLVRWTALVNMESPTLLDSHESEFLVRLSDRVAQSLDRKEEP